jgi:hypothetical protein
MKVGVGNSDGGLDVSIEAENFLTDNQSTGYDKYILDSNGERITVSSS